MSNDQFDVAASSAPLLQHMRICEGIRCTVFKPKTVEPTSTTTQKLYHPNVSVASFYIYLFIYLFIYYWIVQKVHTHKRREKKEEKKEKTLTIKQIAALYLWDEVFAVSLLFDYFRSYGEFMNW